MIFLRLRIVYHSVASLIPPWQGLLRFRERERRGPLSLSLFLYLSIYLSVSLRCLTFGQRAQYGLYRGVACLF